MTGCVADGAGLSGFRKMGGEMGADVPTRSRARARARARARRLLPCEKDPDGARVRAVRKFLPVIAIALALAVVLLIPSSDEQPKLTRSVPPPPPRSSPPVVPLQPVSSASSSSTAPSSSGSGSGSGSGSKSSHAALGVLEAQIVAETAQLARDLELDAKTEERVREITQRTFLELTAEINALREQLELPPDQLEKLLDAKQELLHDRVLAILDKDKAARYRKLVGRE
jgi:hypothetical protein